MDHRERFTDGEEPLRALVDAVKADLWTSMPCTIESVNMEKQTVVLRPSLKARQQMPDGTVKELALPLIPDVPVHFPSGGGVTMTFPIKKGDEVLAVFSSRPIDAWHQSSGEQTQVDARSHDLSDAFAFVGFKSSPKALSNVSASATQIRSDDGRTSIGLDPAAGVNLSTDKAVSIGAASGVSIDGGSGNVTLTGNLNVSGDVVISGVSFLQHVHTHTQPGGGVSGIPQA